MWKFEQEFRLDKPETVGETDREFDASNYIEWLELQLVETRKQLALHNVSKSFAVGENVKVECCIHGHEFEKGQVVTIVEHDPSQTTSWLCSDGRNQWWLNEEEANVS